MRSLLIIVVLGMAVPAMATPAAAFAHGGGLNACGCHFNRKTGECHCHQQRGCGCECQPSHCPGRSEIQPREKPGESCTLATGTATRPVKIVRTGRL